MSPHKKVYCEALGLDESDFIACEVCGKRAVDVHAIEADGMGGRPSKSTHRIENLMALCRICHLALGDRKDLKPALQNIHDLFLLRQ